MREMRIKVIFLMVLMLGMVAILAALDAPASQAEGGYVLSAGTMAAGGEVAGGNYVLKTAVGQAEMGLQSGGAYEMGGGFWGGGPLAQALPLLELFLPILIR